MRRAQDGHYPEFTRSCSKSVNGEREDGVPPADYPRPSDLGPVHRDGPCPSSPLSVVVTTETITHF